MKKRGKLRGYTAVLRLLGLFLFLGTPLFAQAQTNEGCCNDRARCPVGTAASRGFQTLDAVSWKEPDVNQIAWIGPIDCQVKPDGSGYICPNDLWFIYNVPRTREMAKTLVNRGITQFCDPASENLKPTCQQIFQIMIDDLPQRFPDSGRCYEAVEAMTNMAEDIAQTGLYIQKVDRALAPINLNPPATAANSVVVPDPIFTYKAAGLLKLLNGTEPTGANPEDKLRPVLAEIFEQMARVYVAGSAQYSIDVPGNPPVPALVYGMYQGFDPDLINSTSTKVYYRAPRINYSLCPPGTKTGGTGQWQGTANRLNHINRWFKGPNGYVEEGIAVPTWPLPSQAIIRNHQCEGIQTLTDYRSQTVAGAFARGYIIQTIMLEMKKVRDELLLGKIAKLDAYRITDTCAMKEAEIVKIRKRVRDTWDALNAGQTEGAKLGECTDQVNGTSLFVSVRPGAASEKVQLGVQSRACTVASLQTQAELNLAVQYAYCVWRAVGDRVEDLIENALLTTEYKPKAPVETKKAEIKKPAAKPQEPVKASPLASGGFGLPMIFFLLSILASGCPGTQDIPGMTCSGRSVGGTVRSEITPYCVNSCDALVDAISSYREQTVTAKVDLNQAAMETHDGGFVPEVYEQNDKMGITLQYLDIAKQKALTDCNAKPVAAIENKPFGWLVSRSTRNRIRRAAILNNTHNASTVCRCKLDPIYGTESAFGLSDPHFMAAKIQLVNKEFENGVRQPDKMSILGDAVDESISAATASYNGSLTDSRSGGSEGNHKGKVAIGQFIGQNPGQGGSGTQGQPQGSGPDGNGTSPFKGFTPVVNRKSPDGKKADDTDPEFDPNAKGVTYSAPTAGADAGAGSAGSGGTMMAKIEGAIDGVIPGMLFGSKTPGSGAGNSSGGAVANSGKPGQAAMGKTGAANSLGSEGATKLAGPNPNATIANGLTTSTAGTDTANAVGAAGGKPGAQGQLTPAQIAAQTQAQAALSAAGAAAKKPAIGQNSSTLDANALRGLNALGEIIDFDLWLSSLPPGSLFDRATVVYQAKLGH